MRPILLLGKRKHTPPCSSEELFFSLPKKIGGHRGKISGGRDGSPGFCWVSVSTTGPESFSFFEARKVPQTIFFRWWSCTFFSSLFCHMLTIDPCVEELLWGEGNFGTRLFPSPSTFGIHLYSLHPHFPFCTNRN